MTYDDSLRYLDSFLNLERMIYHSDNRLRNLERMRFLIGIFGHPEKHFFPVLIAGTKGKGSTGFFLQSILNASGIPAGFYSSPHLADPRERIRVGGKVIPMGLWVRTLVRIRAVLRRVKVPKGLGDFTYFEVMTLLAMLVFEEAGMKVGIFEVGMGGRLDATNVLDARLNLLTPIEMDHEQILGDTIEKIAREKAAIIRTGAVTVFSPQRHPAARRIFAGRCRRLNAHLIPARPFRKFPLKLRGDFQEMNAGAACKAAEVMRETYGFKISAAGVRRGLRAWDWPGRFETVPGRPELLLDGAHNPASIAVLVRNMKAIYPGRETLLIFGASRDKRSDQMLLELSRFFPSVILTRIPNPRSHDIGRLLAQARGLFRNIYAVGSVKAALELVKTLAGKQTLAVATGSFYLLGEIKKVISQKEKGKRG
jgi:dihydrofolate synthase/folylpolyglutamate synthase